MITRFRAHGEDDLGCFTIEGAIQELEECERQLRADPEVEDVWIEYYDEEEGWIG